MKRSHETRHPRRAFSLVEVVLALGVAAFTVTISFGLISTVMTTGKDTRDRKEIAAALQSLRPNLQEIAGFDKCYSWALRGSPGQELVYVTYRADPATGAPETTSTAIRSVWFDPNSTDPDLGPPHPLADLEAARESRWVKARLTYEAALMPTGSPAALPSESGKFSEGHLVFEVGLAVVAGPGVSLPAKPAFECPIVVNR